MSNADSSRSQLRYLLESTWNVVPSAAMTNMRTTGNSLKPGKQVVRSEEIRNDRMVPGILEVFQDGGGGVNFEMSHLSLHDFISLAFFCSWLTNTVTGSSDISFTLADKKITSGGTPAFNTKFVVGQKIRVSGTVSNNGDKTITAVTATVITVAEALVNESNKSAVIKGSICRNGSTTVGSLLPLVDAKSVILEDEFTDITQFLAYRGCLLDKLNIELASKAIAKGSIDFVAAAAYRAAVTLGNPTTPIAAPTNDIYNCSANVGTIKEGGSTLATALKAVRIALANNVESDDAIGSKYAIDMSKGTIALTGSVDAYWENGNLWDKFINHTTSSLSVALTDATGNTTYITLPALKYATEDVAPGAINQRVIEKLGWEAYRDVTTDCMIQIDELPA